MKITYEELMTELKKYERPKCQLTPDQERALVDARDKYNISWVRIVEIFSEKLGYRMGRCALTDRYDKLKAKEGK